jgi:hypothetical protein
MIFKPDRGHLWHVVHETSTGRSHGATVTLCSRRRGDQAYGPGKRKRGGGAPTCQDCWELDDVLRLPSTARGALEEIATGEWASVANSRGLRELVDRDLLDDKYAQTPRGAALALDFTAGPVPLPDACAVFHARVPLSQYPLCLYGVSGATLEPFVGLRNHHGSYVQLRGLYERAAVNCIACVAMGR